MEISKAGGEKLVLESEMGDPGFRSGNPLQCNQKWNTGHRLGQDAVVGLKPGQEARGMEEAGCGERGGGGTGLASTRSMMMFRDAVCLSCCWSQQGGCFCLMKYREILEYCKMTKASG